MTTRFLPFFLLFAISIACGNSEEKKALQAELANAKPVEAPTQEGLKKAYFAGGCFWCVEGIFESLRGIKKVVSGYSGGHTKNPTYKSVITGRTGHAESVEITYDPELIDFATLIDVYFGSQDPTQKNGQGPDRGSQYRSIIFYQNETEKTTALMKKQLLEQQLQEEVAAEILPFQKFWKAEDYHQDYEEKNPGNPYIQQVSLPRINRFKSKFPDLLKENSQ